MNKTSNQIADEVIETIRASCEASREDDSTEFFLSVRLICEELQARRAVETPSNQRVWEFDRYVDGRLKAEGVRISRAGTFEEACRAAVSLASPGSVLVLRRQDETSATLKECPWCHHSADSEGCIYHESNCAGLETVELNRLQHYMLTRASEKATTPREPPAATTFELNQDRSGCKHCGMLHGHHIVEDEYGRRDVCQRRAQNGSDALP